MDNLTRDIKAIGSLWDVTDKVAIGTIGTKDGRDMDIPTHETALPLEEQTSRLFRTQPTSSENRIAIAVLNGAQRRFYGAIAKAAESFCEDPIAAVFLLDPCRTMEWEKQRSLNKADEESIREFFGKLSPVFLEHDWLVLHDETGLAVEYMPNASKAKCSEHLSFRVPEDDDERVFANVGSWRYGIFPVYDATGTCDEHAAKAALAWTITKDTASFCQRVLRTIGFPEHVSFSMRDFACIIDRVFPSTIDLSAFGEWAWDASCEKAGLEAGTITSREYAVMLDKCSAEDVFCEYEEGKRVHELYRIIWKAFDEEDAKMTHFAWRDLDHATVMFADACRYLGINHQVKAWASGVPIEDVLA